MNVFTIKDLENLSGVKAHTIRIWEQRYSFINPQRTGTNIRFYSNDELKKILNIALLNKFGYKISHIDRMSNDEMNNKILSLSFAQAQQERIVNELLKCMVDLEIDGFESVLNNHIQINGIEKSIIQVIFPLLERIGMLWLSNHINPAQEHLISNIIRQKLIVGIETVQSTIQVDKTLLLFLPEGEHHELGLLFMYYLLKSKGIKVLYVGANAPLKDLAYVAKIKNIDFLYTHLTSVAQNFNLEKFLDNISIKITQVPCIVTGHLTQGYKKKLPPNIQLKSSLNEVMEYIASV